jgi:hypothetical protein
MNFGLIIKVDCVNIGSVPNQNCNDPAFAELNPGICGSTPQLIIQPSNVLCCLLGGVKFSAVQILNGVETDVTASTIFQISDPAIAVIGVSSGRATGVGEGEAVVNATYNGMTTQASLTVIGQPDECGCCDDVEVAMMVVVDNSLSMSQQFNGSYLTKLAYAKAAAKRFIGEVNGTKDLVGLMTFNDSGGTVVSDLSHDENAVAALVNDISQTSQLTGYAAALTAAIGALNASGASELVLVLMSDGVDTSTADSTDMADALALAKQFQSGGGIIICLGVRSSSGGFSFLESLSTGGFFVNAFDSTATAALGYLSGMKGYFCAGNCAPVGDDYVAKGQFDYCAFANWNVVGGHVDLLGNGFLDYLPGNGLYVELAGSDAPHGGAMVSKNSFALKSGHNYRLSLNLAGNQRVAGSPNTVLMKIFGRNNDGLSNPSGAPVLTVNNAGNTLSTTPTYKYAYTYTNANGETAPSPVASATPTTDGASVTVQTAADASADKIRIYRTIGTAPDSPYYLIAEIDNTAPAYTDYMNEADMIAAMAAGTVDTCAVVPTANTTGSTVNYLNQSVSINNYQQGFTPQSFTFTAPSDAVVWISFQQTAFPAGAASTGLLLDSVSFDDTTDIINLLRDDFTNENLTYIPPACGTGKTYVPVGYQYYGQCGSYSNQTTTTLIPLMTSANTPSGIASASDQYTFAGQNNSLYPWKAFDGSAGIAVGLFSAFDHAWATVSYQGWLQYQFNTPQLVNSYSFSINNSSLSWSFQGSNNGSSWTTLDTQTGFNFGSSNANLMRSINTFSFSNTTAYSYYRILLLYPPAPYQGDYLLVSLFQMYSTINVSGNVLCYVQPYGYESGYCCYGEGCLDTPPPAQLQDPSPQPDIESGYTPPGTYQSTQQVCVSCPGEQVNFQPASLIPAMTSDTMPSGIVSASSYSSTNYPWQAFRGFATIAGQLWDAGGNCPQWLQYQFAAEQTIGNYGVTLGLIGASNVSFEFQVSDDGTNWTTVDTQTGLSFYGSERKLFTLGAPASCTFIRLTLTSITIAGTPQQYPFVNLIEVFAPAPLQVCASASYTSEISQTDADSKATAAATAAATAQLNCVDGFTATESFTASCIVGMTGSSVTKSVTATSLISLQDAQNNAQAAAQAAAETALVCVCNDTSEDTITIPLEGAATLYPASQCVSGKTGTITKVTVELAGFYHTSPSDVSVVLMSPTGTIVELMRNCGGENAVFEASDCNIIFDDSAANPLPDNAQIVSGTYKPTQRGLTVSLPAPCPSGTPHNTLAAFIGEDPNGVWNLFVFDSQPLDGGAIVGGFAVNITSA